MFILSNKNLQSIVFLCLLSSNYALSDDTQSSNTRQLLLVSLATLAVQQLASRLGDLSADEGFTRFREWYDGHKSINGINEMREKRKTYEAWYKESGNKFQEHLTEHSCTLETCEIHRALAEERGYKARVRHQ